MTNTKGAYKTCFLNADLRAQLQAYLDQHPVVGSKPETYSRLVQRLLSAFFTRTQKGQP